MRGEHRDRRCNRCKCPDYRSLPDEIRADIRRKKKELVWAIVELVLTLALAAAIGAILLWSSSSSGTNERRRSMRAPASEERTE